ncbi:cytosolic sulfotransferase 5-like [Phragmites australis]|uniref:cytosolic sulfotransferase 5-like n=1 Tax=Phragmites australis TaxID=29695 RepID=UPI002D766EB7|nr:cytosolic sulfotransferase 5-like [Phragmites australis]
MATACKGGGKGEAMTLGEGDESPMTNDVFPDNFAEIVASLPQGPPCPVFPSLRLYRGFWYPEGALMILPKVHASFNKLGTDILFASFPKTGTTWLKALGFATARRSVHSPFDGGHPLLSNISHDCVKFIDNLKFLDDDDTAPAAPRLLGTHLPYSLLPKRATADGSGCRIVYITRDPKDTLVSLWHFEARVQTTAEEGTAQHPTAAAAAEFEEAFEQYCQGRCGLGPQWEHAREYWEASKRRPGNVLCLRYEEMLQDPAGNLKKMAEFMGCPFSAAEEEAGVVRAIIELCSLDKQRRLAVNKTGAYRTKNLMTIDNKHFFRKGVPGDWRNHMTPEMAARLDGIVEEALKGSGFTFGNTK